MPVFLILLGGIVTGAISGGVAIMLFAHLWSGLV